MLEVAALQHDALGGGANDEVVGGSVGQGRGGGHGQGHLAAGEQGEGDESGRRRACTLQDGRQGAPAYLSRLGTILFSGRT